MTASTRSSLLSAPAEVIGERIAVRTTNDYGKAPSERALILEQIATVEPLLRAGCTHELDESRRLGEIVDDLVNRRGGGMRRLSSSEWCRSATRPPLACSEGNGTQGDRGAPLGGDRASAAPASAALPAGAAYAPRNGHAYHGVSDTGARRRLRRFRERGRRPPGRAPGVLSLARAAHDRSALSLGATDTRGVLSLSTATGAGEEMITPRQIAKGEDDRYMTHMAANIAETGQTVYIRLMAEMNGHWNAYSAYNADGSARRRGHSAHWSSSPGGGSP